MADSEIIIIPAFLEKVVDFPECSYELLQPLTPFRSCHDGTPAEARIVFTCRRLGPAQHEADHEFIIKIKVQGEPSNPASTQKPEAGPSTTTAAEIEALEIFTKDSNAYTPQLIDWKRAVQGDDCPLPGGYITYTVMTKLPGETLFDLQFWQKMETEEREAIVQEFLLALRSIYRLGIEPIDCALRNVLWDRQTKKSSIIDFELWRETNDTFADETKVLQRWGLAPPPITRDWATAWKMQMR